MMNWFVQQASLDDGSLVRIYPLPFRKLEYENRYKKYQWMELPLVKTEKDPRPESYKVTDMSKVRPIGEPVGTEQMWAKRKEIIFEKNTVYTDLGELIEKANRNELSLALFKPTEIVDFIVEEAERDWDRESLDTLRAKLDQLSLFQSPEEIEKEFRVVQKLPFTFSYRFRDCTGRESTLMIGDWEIGALYWNCLKQCEGNEEKALVLVRKKYMEEFAGKDLYLFLGTTRQFHGWAKNPFVIIGVFYPPMTLQLNLL